MLLGAICSAQELPKIVPPSPEATSIAKFTEVPVSHYTGLPNINIPIYTIQSAGTTVPIGLSYHARGIRVEEIASRVGIGWALNAGGVISRQVRDGVDEGSKGYLVENYYNSFETNEQTRSYVYSNSLSGSPTKIDLVPDQFNFQFPGGSGKFIFDQQTKEPILQSYSDLKIEKNGYQWIITASNGYKYYFGEPAVADANRVQPKNTDITFSYVYDNSGLSGGADPSPSAINSWYLLDIVSPTGEKIHFNYEVENIEFYRRSYDKFDKTTNGQSSYFSRVKSTQYQLSNIVFETGKVVFNKSSTTREDLSGSKSLESIDVFETIGGQEKRIKKYKFEYSYSNDVTSANVLPYLKNIEPSSKKRLFLDAVKKVSNSGVSQHYYAIEYTNKADLPNRFSNSQDLWGYYNGKNNGSYLTFNTFDNATNREVDEAKAKVGLISKIITPTRGYSKFTFETNKAVPPLYFHNLFYKNTNPISSTSKFANLLKDAQYLVANGDYEKTFSVGDNPVNFRSQVSFFGNFGQCSTTQNISQCKYQVSIVGVNGTSYFTNLYMGLQTHSTLLPKGDYKLVVKVLGGDNPSDLQNGFTIALSWDEEAISEPELTYSGGNRIREIEINSIDNGKITKSYQYVKENGESSGLLYSLPGYYFKNEEFGIDGTVVKAEAYGAKPGSPYSYAQGNHVGYSHVTEYINDGNVEGAGGKISYEFTAMSDGGEFYKPPYTLPVNNEWLRGKPLKVTYYKRENSNYVVVKKDEFSYRYAASPGYKTITDPAVGVIPQPGVTIPSMYYLSEKKQHNIPLITFKLNADNPVGSNHNDYKVYNLNGGVSNLYSKKETTYLEGEALESETTYFYNYDKHYQISQTKQVNSKGEVLLSKTVYPQDKVSPTATEQALISANRFEPIESYSYKDVNDNQVIDNGELLTSQKTIYNHTKWPGLNLPEKVQTSVEDGNLEDRVVYHSYDDKGNPTEVSKKDGTHIVYIWGYEKTQPVAKIENAKLSDIPASTITSIQNASNLDVNTASENTLRTSLNALRGLSSLSQAQVTTFTYDPLVGVTSITDPRGQTMYYEYDDFNRLKFVKDNEGKLLKETTYNYKN